MRLGEKFYSKNLKRTVHPGEEIYLTELKNHIEERILFYKNTGCGALNCNSEVLLLRNELNNIHSLIIRL